MMPTSASLSDGAGTSEECRGFDVPKKPEGGPPQRGALHIPVISRGVHQGRRGMAAAPYATNEQVFLYNQVSSKAAFGQIRLGRLHRENCMKPHPIYFVAGLVLMIGCLAKLSTSPAWKQLTFFDLMAMLGAGIALGMMIAWTAVRTGSKPGPKA